MVPNGKFKSNYFKTQRKFIAKPITNPMYNRIYCCRKFNPVSVWTGVNFLSQLLKSVFILQDCSLQQIMDHETDIVKDTLTLHSDMQTLVYENYNKFISATDTVKKVGFVALNDCFS